MNKRRMQTSLLAVLAAVFVACAAAQTEDTSRRRPELASSSAGSVAELNAIADEMLARSLETSSYLRMLSGLPVTQIEDISPGFVEQEAEFSRKLLTRLDRIDPRALPHEQWLLAGMLRDTLANGASGAANYWFEFAVTPYTAGLKIAGVHQVLAAQSVKTAAERDNYVHLLDEYAALLDQAATKTLGQAQRGIRIPKPAIPSALATIQGLSAAAPAALSVNASRLAGVAAAEASAFNAAVAQVIALKVVPAYGRIVEILGKDYARQAPEQVGVGQFPGGKEYYLRQIKFHTALTLTPQEIHELGRKRIDEIEAAMRAIRDRLGYRGTREEFHQMLQKDPRFLARTPAEVEQRYLKYIGRIEPLIPKYFSRLPQARYGVKRLDPAAEPGMTYGFYQMPSPADPVGYYRYNGSELDKRSLITAAHLIYHELIPGHHFHMAVQRENKGVHPVREFLLYGAFNEGWAEYAASLAEEMGILDDPYDQYGHLLMQGFLTSRLVVDSGMNHFSWPLERAREYMKAHTFESDVQIASESLRYSTDLPAQALGYRLGYEKIWELRRRAEAALGDKFDIRAFHAAVVGGGALPLNVLEGHIDWFIAQQRAGH